MTKPTIESHSEIPPVANPLPLAPEGGSGQWLQVRGYSYRSDSAPIEIRASNGGNTWAWRLATPDEHLLIVRAVNAHDDLIAALRESQSVLAELAGGDPNQSAMHLWARVVAAEAKARAAITKATELAA